MVYGEDLSRQEVESLTSTTKRNGTDTAGLKSALTKLGYNYQIYETTIANNAWRWVLTNSINYPLILYVDKEHWTVIAGRIQNKVIMLDSVASALIVGKEELLKRWKDKTYWGMKITMGRS